MINKKESIIYNSIVGRIASWGESTTFSPFTDLIHRWLGGIMKICKIKECNNKYHAKGYCDKHYQRFKKYNDPFIMKLERHGKMETPEYITWQDMKARCYNKNHNYYKYYGGRGITVCERWRNSFLTFLEDMGKRPFPEAQIDRLNNDGNYEPGNCRWTTGIENCRHQSSTKLTIIKAAEIKEQYMIENITQKELGSLYGVTQSLISFIINNKRWISF